MGDSTWKGNNTWVQGMSVSPVLGSTSQINTRVELDAPSSHNYKR